MKENPWSWQILLGSGFFCFKVRYLNHIFYVCFHRPLQTYMFYHFMGFFNRRSPHFYLKEIFKSNFPLSLQGERQIAFPPKFLQSDSVPHCAAMINNAIWII